MGGKMDIRCKQIFKIIKIEDIGTGYHKAFISTAKNIETK